MGRWLSPDWAPNVQAVPYADFTHPQTLNLYQYEENNPLSKADSDGHCGDLCGWLISTVSTKVGTYLAQHPDVAEAISKVGDTAGIKGALGFGGTVKLPGAPATKGEGSITGYISLSADKGLSEGVEGKLGGKLGPLGGEVSGSLPIVKGGDLVNPITNATGSASGTLTGETESSKLSGAGSANGEDTAVGGNYGEGVVGGLEVSVGTDSLIDVGKEMVNGLINDTKQLATYIKTAATCTQSSGCTPPK
jgi:hypothetical protein